MFAADPLARHYAQLASDARHLKHVESALRVFFCVPVAHSEDMADREMSVCLEAKLGEPWLTRAEGHRDIIQRFGRFLSPQSEYVNLIHRSDVAM
ncbi:DUF924 family protein [Agrobacterium cavarae]|uniref:DUF924 family protein n=1 Tax=Agrobacterium cavarae TaxID=2528239 RepID=UPI003FCF8D05